jgi:hypothetical protein
MPIVITLLTRFGLTDALAKKLAPFAAALAVIAFLSLLWGAWQVWDYFDDRAAIKADRLEGNNAALEAQLEADAAAARERLRNAATNSETKEALQDAIDQPEPGDSPDPDVRLACEQLRLDGQDTTAIPGCGGR